MIFELPASARVALKAARDGDPAAASDLIRQAASLIDAQVL
jgi:hypothetical protein